jgi:hypothetical protein
LLKSRRHHRGLHFGARGPDRKLTGIAAAAASATASQAAQVVEADRLRLAGMGAAVRELAHLGGVIFTGRCRGDNCVCAVIICWEMAALVGERPHGAHA